MAPLSNSYALSLNEVMTSETHPEILSVETSRSRHRHKRSQTLNLETLEKDSREQTIIAPEVW